MGGSVGELARGGIVGLPPRAVLRMLESGVDATQYLDHRGVGELRCLEEAEVIERERNARRSLGCVEAVLGLPVLKQVREFLPQDLKDAVKNDVKEIIKFDGCDATEFIKVDGCVEP